MNAMHHNSKIAEQELVPHMLSGVFYIKTLNFKINKCLRVSE